MTPEVGETDYRIGTFIIRLFCGIVGVVGLVGIVVGLVSWLEDRSAYTSLWTALVGDEPYGRAGSLGGFRLGGGKLWRLTPNGLLPACGELCLWVASLAAALFHRWWLYALMVGLLILMDI